MLGEGRGSARSARMSAHGPELAFPAVANSWGSERYSLEGYRHHPGGVNAVQIPAEKILATRRGCGATAVRRDVYSWTGFLHEVRVAGSASVIRAATWVALFYMCWQ